MTLRKLIKLNRQILLLYEREAGNYKPYSEIFPDNRSLQIVGKCDTVSSGTVMTLKAT